MHLLLQTPPWHPGLPQKICRLQLDTAILLPYGITGRRGQASCQPPQAGQEGLRPPAQHCPNQQTGHCAIEAGQDSALLCSLQYAIGGCSRAPCFYWQFHLLM